MGLKGSKTEQNLKDAFAGESQANRRYLYFANKADVEGQNDVAALFRSTAEGETGHAHGGRAAPDSTRGLSCPLSLSDTRVRVHTCALTTPEARTHHA
jgi:rubrerythrin